jgi:hypothetical protein
MRIRLFRHNMSVLGETSISYSQTSIPHTRTSIPRVILFKDRVYLLAYHPDSGVNAPLFYVEDTALRIDSLEPPEITNA